MTVVVLLLNPTPRQETKDPCDWPKYMNGSLQDMLVQARPHHHNEGNGQRDEGQHKFSVAHYNRRMANGERVERPRSVYSKQNDAAFCFCCKLFSQECKSAVVRDGTRDWRNQCLLLSLS